MSREQQPHYVSSVPFEVKQNVVDAVTRIVAGALQTHEDDNGYWDMSLSLRHKYGLPILTNDEVLAAQREYKMLIEKDKTLDDVPSPIRRALTVAKCSWRLRPQGEEPEATLKKLTDMFASMGISLSQVQQQQGFPQELKALLQP